MTAGSQRGSRLALACAVALLASTLSTVGCGDSPASSDGGGAAAQRAYEIARARGAVNTASTPQSPLRGTGGNEANDENSASAANHARAGTGQNPCALVTHEQAQAIVGAPVAPPQEAPLGPTCIYRRTSGADYVTVAVESSGSAALLSRLRGRRRIEIHGHAAYCGYYGRPITLVPLGGRRVLNVAAACSVGERFAAAALTRMNG